MEVEKQCSCCVKWFKQLALHLASNICCSYAVNLISKHKYEQATVNDASPVINNDDSLLGQVIDTSKEPPPISESLPPAWDRGWRAFPSTNSTTMHWSQWVAKCSCLQQEEEKACQETNGMSNNNISELSCVEIVPSSMGRQNFSPPPPHIGEHHLEHSLQKGNCSVSQW
jgi:hypothetical protein